MVTKIVWRKNNFSQLRRIFGNMNDLSEDVKKDHALEWGKANEKLGVWSFVTDEIGDKDNPTIIRLENSHNPIRVQSANNKGRGNKPKISQQIWQDGSDVIDIWYWFNFRLTKKLMDAYKLKKENLSDDEKKFYQFILDRYKLMDSIENKSQEEIRAWVHDTVVGIQKIKDIDMKWFFDKPFKENGIKVDSYIGNSLLMIVEDTDEDEVKYYAAACEFENAIPYIKNAIGTLNNTNTQGSIKLDYIHKDEKIESIYNSLIKHKNVILYGPPGTGKSYIMNKLKERFSQNQESITLNKLDYSNPFKIESTEINKETISKWCTFHPNYSYENFIIGMYPVINNNINSNNPVYKTIKGPFLELALKASPKIWYRDNLGCDRYIENNDNCNSLLLIDEINRANTAEVFGDTITIIEKNKRLNQSGDRCNAIPIVLNNEFDFKGIERINELYMPESMYIIGTMNSLDKSVVPLDAAFKRRFKVININPDEDILKKHLGLKDEDISDEKDNEKFIKVFGLKLFRNINKFIKVNFGEEQCFGHAYLWELGESSSDLENILESIIRYKITPHLKTLLIDNEDIVMELFGEDNKDLLYHEIEDEFNYIIRMKSIDNLTQDELLLAYSRIAKINYEAKQETETPKLTYDLYFKEKIESIYDRLIKNKSCILSGPPGTGKTHIANEIRKKMGEDTEYKFITFHPAMSYQSFVGGIKPKLNSDGHIQYKYEKGTILKMNDYKDKNKLLIIDEINRGDCADIMGEMITLFEKDKRDKVSISVPYKDEDGKEIIISLDDNLYTLGTMNTLDKSIMSLDSALKRRFDIIDINPDYKLLSLYFDVEEKDIDWNNRNKKDNLYILVKLLENINKKIIKYRSEDYQIGHAYIWELKDSENPLSDFYDIFDSMIKEVLEELLYGENECYEEIFGIESPILDKDGNMYKLKHFSELNQENKVKVIKGIYSNEL